MSIIVDSILILVAALHQACGNASGGIIHVINIVSSHLPCRDSMMEQPIDFLECSTLQLWDVKVCPNRAQ